MREETGYRYLNEANQWPKFVLDVPADPKVAIGSDGSLSLVQNRAGDFARSGVIVGGPFDGAIDNPRWHRLRVAADPLPPGAHIQLFTTTVQAGDPDPFFDPSAQEPFPGWHKAPRDILDILVPRPSLSRLWVGAILRGEGATSPRINQMRADYGRDTYLNYLPAIYSRGEAQREFAERALSLFESTLGAIEEDISDLPLLFDPAASPIGGYPSWFLWLAGWLAFDLNEYWPEADARANLAQAYDLYRQRGTVAGLRRALKMYAGVEAYISEPGRHTHLWTLGETSTLGVTTMLAAGEPQGAVLGTSATVDKAHVSQYENFGAALFDDLAFHFCVNVFCADLNRPGALADARLVIEREKPAHTTYHLCVIEPRLRLGVQARVGIDAIVASGPLAAQTGLELGLGTIQEGPIEPRMKVGIQSRTGIDSVVAASPHRPLEEPDGA